MKDKCIRCEEETKYDESTHVDLREHYIDGGGQLCKVCWDKVFDSKIGYKYGAARRTNLYEN